MKAIITDLDRTLLRTDKTISEYTCSVLKKCQERGILLMIATARPERAILTYLEQIKFEAVTTLNGAKIILPHGTIENGIIPSSAERILRKAVKIPDAAFQWKRELVSFPMFRSRKRMQSFFMNSLRCLQKALSINCC